MEYTDVMLHLETVGNRSNTAIVSIGAVEFNIVTGETGREFYEVVGRQSCLDIGRKVQASTIYWWMQQDQKARERICQKGVGLNDALLSFNTWMRDCVEKVRIWGNGARFDIGILEDAYVACYIDVPWYFRSERDVRTLVSFAPHVKENMPFEGVYHDPVDDCKHQIKYCSKIWNMFFRTLDESKINQSQK